MVAAKQQRGGHRFAQDLADPTRIVPMFDQRAPCGVQMYEVSANRVSLEHEAMQAVAVMHLCAGPKLCLEQLVELRRIRLAPGRLHHLADEETEQFVLA